MNQYPQYTVPPVSDLLNLGVGQPGKEYLTTPHVMMNIATRYVDNDVEIMQYGFKSGCLSFRQDIVNLLSKYTKNTMLNTDAIYMTNGVSQGVFFLASMFKARTHNVFVENPSYFIMLKSFQDLGYTSNTIDLENDLTYEFERKLNNIGKNQTVLVYLVPFHHNPTGKTITSTQIKQLVKICNKFPNLYIFSDETYIMLSFDDIKFKSFCEYHPNMISISTFSKILAPAFRLGWVYTHNKKIIDMLNGSSLMDSGGAVQPIMANIVSNILKTETFESNLLKIKLSLKEKCNILKNEILKYPDVFDIQNIPSGGYFLWIKSKKLDAESLLKIATANKINFHIGNKFSHDNSMNDYFRLSFSYYTADELTLFADRLKCIVDNINNLNKYVVHILGCEGKMGSLIREECLENNMNVFAIDRTYNITTTSYNKHIIVDVSSPAGTTSLLNYLIDNKLKIPLLIGTTGDLPYDLIEKYGKMAQAQVIVRVCSNFSIGINMIQNMLNYTNHLPDCFEYSIDETHHTEKKDAPSGTALTLKKIINNNGINNVDINSNRVANVIGTHNIVMQNDCEKITITHEALDRRIFAKGCVKIIQTMLKQT